MLGVPGPRFGSVFVLALAQRAEARSGYDDDADATPTMAADEAIHEEVVRGLAARGPQPDLGARSARRSSARTTVWSATWRWCSASAAAASSTSAVLLTGLAGLLAGALSMGAGEYVSVRSQRELLEASTAGPRGAGGSSPHLDVDANELALVYRARGMEPAEAQARADEVLGSLGGTDALPPRARRRRRARVVGTAVGAAAASFCFFASGAAIPVLPYLLGAEGLTAVVWASVLVGLALLATGATVGVLSGASPGEARAAAARHRLRRRRLRRTCSGWRSARRCDVHHLARVGKPYLVEANLSP